MTIALNDDFRFKGANYSTSQTTSTLARHRWYVIKEGFSPKLVEAAIDASEVKATDLVIDPFCGSGTVPLTAAQHSVRTIGIEVNPFLAFVSTTKLRNCGERKLVDAAAHVVNGIYKGRNRRSHLEGFSTFSVGTRLEKWLFNVPVLRSFEAGWRAASSAEPRTQRFLKLALVKSAMENCNAKADGKCLRYKSDWKKLDYGTAQFVDSFREHMSTIVSDVKSDVVPNLGTRIVNKDSRRFLLEYPPRGFQLCVTSPPYLNSFDYSDVYRPELFLAKFVMNNAELRNIRLRTIRSHVQVTWEKPRKSAFGHVYKTTIEQIRAVGDHLWDRRLPLMVQAYFEDMQSVLINLKKAAAPSAQAWFVVSTSAYGGVEIPVDLILAEMGERVGWFLQEIGVIRHVRHAGHHWNKISEDARKSAWLRESVVVFKAGGKR